VSLGLFQTVGLSVEVRSVVLIISLAVSCSPDSAKVIAIMIFSNFSLKLFIVSSF